jgi:hypothetical protein
MTDRERQFAALGIEYAEGIDRAERVTVPATGRTITRVVNGWEAQPHNDNYHRTFPDLLDALRFATPPKAEAQDRDEYPDGSTRRGHQ